MSSSRALPVPTSAAVAPAPRFSIPYAFTPHGTFLAYDDTKHLMTFGPTGTGKGATVIVPALLLVRHSVLCIDPKGQLAAVTARRRRELGQDVHFLNPFNEHGLGTSHFNPLARLRIDQPNVMADARSLADALIVPGEKDSHWTDSAVDLLTALLLYLIATQPGTATLGDMRRLLTHPEALFVKTIRAMLELTDYPFIGELGARFGSGTNEIASVISTAITQTTVLSDTNIKRVLSKNDFSMAQLKERPTTVYIILNARFANSYSRFLRLLVTSALDQLTITPDGYRTLFILDEFPMLHGLPAVSRAFGIARDYKVQCWPFLQDITQLQDIYGKRWETFMANAGVVQFFTPGDMTTAEYLMRRGGHKEVVQRSLSLNEVSQQQAKGGFSGLSMSFSKAQQPLLPPEITMSMSNNGQYLFFSGKHSPRGEYRLPYFLNPRLAGLYDPDPFNA